MAFTHGYALLIGVNENSVHDWALPDVAKDVKALSAVLAHHERCAYPQEHVRVIQSKDATKSNIWAGLSWLKDKLKEDSDKNTTVLIYYSGHGWRDSSLPDQPAYYLIPFDVAADNLRQTALRADDFASQIASLSPQRLLVLLDCCHAGGMGVKDLELSPFTIPAGWFMGKEKAIPVDFGNKDIDAAILTQGAGRAVLNSSRNDEKSYIRQDRQMSIFTYHLIEALTGYAPHKDADKEVTVADLLGYVWRAVPESAQREYGKPQHPDGQLSGNFPVALLLGGNGTPDGKSPPDPLAELPDEKNKTSASTIFDQRDQVVNGSQTNIAGDIYGPILSGNIYGSVNLDQHENHEKNDSVNVKKNDYPDEGYDGEKSIKDIKGNNNKEIQDKQNLKNLLELIEKKYFRMSVAHPKLLAKRYESPFVVSFYFDELDFKVKLQIEKIIDQNSLEHNYETKVGFGYQVKVKCYSPDIAFPDPISKKLESSINTIVFLAKPTDKCEPGEHKVTVSILDHESGLEHQSEIISVRVADFAFDHISYPLLSRVASIILGLGSFTMFVLTLLEQIDKTIGLTAGTSAGLSAVFIYVVFYAAFQRIKSAQHIF